MAEAQGRSTGTVEEEAQRLVTAAGEWLRNRQENGHPPGAATAGGSSAGVADDEATDRRGNGPGAEDDHTTCRGCPWCRAKAYWGANGSETLESLADLLDAAAESLRLYAQSRREPEEGQPGSRPQQEQEQA